MNGKGKIDTEARHTDEANASSKVLHYSGPFMQYSESDLSIESSSYGLRRIKSLDCK